MTRYCLLILTNGQEIMGEMIHAEDDKIVLKNPLVMNLFSNDSGIPGLYFEPYCFFVSTNEIPFSMKHVQQTFQDKKIRSDIIQHYRETLQKINSQKLGKIMDEMNESEEETVFINNETIH